MSRKYPDFVGAVIALNKQGEVGAACSGIGEEDYNTILNFPRQSLKIFTFRVKLSDSIFFSLGLSPIVKLI